MHSIYLFILEPAEQLKLFLPQCYFISAEICKLTNLITPGLLTSGRHLYAFARAQYFYTWLPTSESTRVQWLSAPFSGTGAAHWLFPPHFLQLPGLASFIAHAQFLRFRASRCRTTRGQASNLAPPFFLFLFLARCASATPPLHAHARCWPRVSLSLRAPARVRLASRLHVLFFFSPKLVTHAPFALFVPPHPSIPSHLSLPSGGPGWCWGRTRFPASGVVSWWPVGFDG